MTNGKNRDIISLYDKSDEQKQVTAVSAVQRAFDGGNKVRAAAANGFVRSRVKYTDFYKLALAAGSALRNGILPFAADIL